MAKSLRLKFCILSETNLIGRDSKQSLNFFNQLPPFQPSPLFRPINVGLALAQSAGLALAGLDPALVGLALAQSAGLDGLDSGLTLARLDLGDLLGLSQV